MKVTILHEDQDICVIDKPAGMIVNTADTTKGQETVQEWAEERLGVSGVSKVSSVPGAQIEQGDFYNRAGIVHRLDKETSGILVLAKNPQAFLELQRQFKERIVEKTYLALAHGKVAPSEGEIKAPVGRLPWNRTQFGVVAGGRESVTYYKVKEYLSFDKEIFSFLELHPKTGRTHQIRVHLKYIGHPIFADFLYAGRKVARADRKILERVFLHAAGLSLLHPKTGERMSFTSPLPEELKNVMKQMEKVN